MEFSLFYFSSEAAEYAPDKYRLLVESVRYADTHDFAAVWVPERHFHPLGGVFPNPAVVASALAMITSRVRLRSGSIVLPLHHPVRAAEDWAIVDNLSNGRVDLSFARGWNANDFVLAPDAFGAGRTARLYESIDIVRRLWRGEAVSFRNGNGEDVPTRIYPQPRQRELGCWLTCSGPAERFEEAGTRGFNVLTSLILQPVDDLIEKLGRYREARARAGHDPATGRVTLMLHAFVADDEAEVRQAVQSPFKEYIRTTVDLWAGSSRRLEEMTAEQQRELLDYSFERYYRTSALFGTPASCLPLVRRLAQAGVHEIACLVDFGVPTNDVLASLDALDRLRRLANAPPVSRDGRDGTPADRTALLRELLQRRASTADAAPTVQAVPDKTAALRVLLERRAAAHTEIHPLSQGQQSLWFLHLQHPESAAYNTAVSLRVRSPLDRRALARAVQQLADRHAVLRTTFGEGPDGPIQIVHGYRPLVIEEVDGSAWDDATLHRHMRDAYARPFDLRDGSVARAHLFRLAPDDAVFMLCIHHIARDGWSMTLLLEEWQRLYEAESRDTRLVLPPPGATYTDFVHREAARVASPEGTRLRHHWREALAGAPTVLNLPTDHPRPPVLAARGGTVTRQFGEDVIARVQAVARAAGATTNTLLLSVFALLLHRYTAEDDLLIGSPALGRDDPAMHDVVGYFVNPVVMRATIRPEESFAALVGRMQREVVRAASGQGLPFPVLVRELDPPRDASRSTLVQVLFYHVRAATDRPLQSLLLPGAPDAGIEIDGLRVESCLVTQEEGQFDLSMEIIERPTGFHVALKYHADLFERETAERMLEHWARLLDAVSRWPDLPVNEHDLLSDDERATLLDRWNDTDAPVPAATIHGLVEAQVARTPDAIAVSDERERLSYRELDARAGRLAAHLDRGAGERPLTVGLHVEPSAGALTAILAVLKAGGTYVPLDPAYPVERLEFMARDAGVSVLISDRAVPERLAAGANVVDLRALALAESASDAPWTNPRPVRPDDAAYILYTSGSTGTPKGVRVAHASLVNLLGAVQALLEPAASDRLLSITPLSFDIVAVELLLPLVAGAEVEIAPRAVATDPARLRARLERGDVTIMQATATTWRLLVDAGWRDGVKLRAISTGEALAPALAEALATRIPRVWNLYGPTETTVFSTGTRVVPGGPERSIGRPLRNTTTYVVDAKGRPVPIGLPGELLIGGIGVALGYHGRPELTEARFIPDPFRPERGGRLYRTGDRARYRRDGGLDFLGRLDEQVKLNGNRIELGEVEAAMSVHPAVGHAVVVLQTRDDAHARLVGFWTARPDAMPPTHGELRRLMSERVPAVMIPSVFERLDALPRTPSGKVDRLALSRRAVTARAERALDADGRRPADDATQRELAAIWRRVLRVDAVGPGDNFFDLGGASIDVIQLVSRVRRAGWAIEAGDVFRHQTLASLAAVLGPRGAGGDPMTAAAEGVEVPAKLLERHVATTNGVAGAAAPGRCRTVIESMGVYLPPDELTTADVLRGCLTPLSLDLEQLTGIRTRRRAAPHQFSIDLAVAAVTECMARSSHSPEDVDLVICCNISRYDGPRRITFEPGTAVRLRDHFGLQRARAFDISNACPGTFTALKIADLFFRTGEARCALVVSGEYITHLTDTAQREIDGVLDPRLACLTVGDSGLALLAEPSPDGTTGFHEIDLLTLGRHSELCIARPTQGAHGGGIMVTDSLRLSDIALREGLNLSLELLDRRGETARTFQHFVMHQTSSTTIRNATRELNRLFGRDVLTPENTVDNLAERGNTSTTTHFVALWDEIQRGRVKAGDRVLFSISGSGVTLGTALYTMDDLPARLTANGHAHDRRRAARRPLAALSPAGERSRARIASHAVLPCGHPALSDTVAALHAVSDACLRRTRRSPHSVDVVLYAGVHRTDFVCEPATAARLAGALGLGHGAGEGADGTRRVLAFDVFNGPLGFLDACQIAMLWLESGEASSVLVATSEVDPNRGRADRPRTGVEPGAAAILLERAEKDGAGFGAYRFHGMPRGLRALKSYCTWDDGGAYLHVEESPDAESELLDAIAHAVPEFLRAHRLALTDLDVVLPPHPSAGFAERFASCLRLSPAVVVATPDTRGDLLTCALPYALHEAFRSGLATPGALGLLVSAGVGPQVGCALYRF